MSCNCMNNAIDVAARHVTVTRRETLTKGPYLVQTVMRMSDWCTVTYTDVKWQEIVIRKDGTKVPKTKKAKVLHSYCPWCGQKYERKE